MTQNDIPVTGADKFQVEEYSLVEQSTDNPTHHGFLNHIPGAVVTRRAPWRNPEIDEALEKPNTILIPLGFRLAMNPTPPFSAYALYQGDRIVQEGIHRFWPVTTNDSGSDFLFPYETLSGSLLVASRDGLKSWPGTESTQTTPPVYIGNRLAYASTDGSKVSVYAEGQTIYQFSTTAIPGQIYTWDQGHWAFTVDNRIVQDGKDFAPAYDDLFGWQSIEGRPFYFFTQDGVTQLSYNGTTLPNKYDQVVHRATGEASQFNPGGNENMVWFYALRDGLWYYVEAGIFD